jgi:hypothetical protein
MTAYTRKRPVHLRMRVRVVDIRLQDMTAILGGPAVGISHGAWVVLGVGAEILGHFCVSDGSLAGFVVWWGLVPVLVMMLVLVLDVVVSRKESAV